MVKEKKSLEEKNQSFKDSDFVQDWDRANLSTYSSWSWDLVWHKWYAWKYFVIFLIILWISIVAGLLDWLLSYAFWLDSDHSFSLFSDIAGVVLSVWLLWVSINIAKWLVQKIWDFFREITWNRIWKVFCVSIVIWIIMVFCSAIFIASLISSESWVNIPLLVLWIILLACWIFVGLRLNFAQYAVVDKWYWPKEALVYSRNITKWHFWEIVLFSLYFVAINLLWMLCVLVGLVWTVPMTYLATSKYYRMLSEIYDNWSKKK
jgi:hypothetical protein